MVELNDSYELPPYYLRKMTRDFEWNGRVTMVDLSQLGGLMAFEALFQQYLAKGDRQDNFFYRHLFCTVIALKVGGGLKRG